MSDILEEEVARHRSKDPKSKLVVRSDTKQHKASAPAKPFRVRIPVHSGMVMAAPMTVLCDTLKEAEKAAQAQVKTKKYGLVDVEEHVSHTWMLRRRWTRKNGWMVV